MDNRVRERRKELKISQTELSLRTGISRTTLNKIESGRQTNVKTSTIIRLATALAIAPEQLFLF